MATVALHSDMDHHCFLDYLGVPLFIALLLSVSLIVPLCKFLTGLAVSLLPIPSPLSRLGVAEHGGGGRRCLQGIHQMGEIRCGMSTTCEDTHEIASHDM